MPPDSLLSSPCHVWGERLQALAMGGGLANGCAEWEGTYQAYQGLWH